LTVATITALRKIVSKRVLTRGHGAKQVISRVLQTPDFGWPQSALVKQSQLAHPAHATGNGMQLSLHDEGTPGQRRTLMQPAGVSQSPAASFLGQSLASRSALAGAACAA
jgi:hypothetical protein